MTLREPESMDECVYFTNRAIGKGKVRAWVLREQCPKCGKGLMGKPRDRKTGKPMIRAEEYECPECRYNVPKEEYENTLTINVKYTCSKCSNEGEGSAPFQWKKVQRLNEETGKKQSIDSIRLICSKCNEKIDVTRKMK